MLVNTTSTFSNLLAYHCFNVSIAMRSIRAILVLPLSTFVLFLGLQKKINQRSFKAQSHSNVFTYNLVVMELLWVFGYLCRICAEYFGILEIKTVGFWAASFTFYGEMLFHILTCAEHYIAVVHPVTYLGLKGTYGVRIRNISIGLVWLLCLILISLSLVLIEATQPILLYCLLVFTLIVTTFCSVTVLHVLIHPGPGKGAVEKEQVNKSKQRAFHTIAAISSVQWLWFIGLLVSTALTKSSTLGLNDACLIETSLGFCNLPSNLVLPLLYLLKADILPWCCYYHR